MNSKSLLLPSKQIFQKLKNDCWCFRDNLFLLEINCLITLPLSLCHLFGCFNQAVTYVARITDKRLANRILHKRVFKQRTCLPPSYCYSHFRQYILHVIVFLFSHSYQKNIQLVLWMTFTTSYLFFTDKIPNFILHDISQ